MKDGLVLVVQSIPDIVSVKDAAEFFKQFETVGDGLQLGEVQIDESLKVSV